MSFIKPFNSSIQKKFKKILVFREEQHAQLEKIINQYHLPVITVNLNIPGINKNNNRYWTFFQHYLSILINNLNEKYVLHEVIVVYEKVAFSAMLVIEENNPFKTKLELLNFEKKHAFVMPLFDLDVYSNSLKKIHRIELETTERKCYLCALPAKECARQKTHSIDELVNYIDNIIDKENNVCRWKIKSK